MKIDNVILCSIFIFASILTFSSLSIAEEPGDYWLQLTESQRINYLVGYVQGADPAVDVSKQYKGTVFEDLLYSSQKLRKGIIKRVTKLYENKKNKLIIWKSMILLVCSELLGESKDIVEERLLMFRELYRQHFGQKYTRAGDSWLSLSQTDRHMYLKGLIEGTRTNIILGEQQHSDIKALYEGLVNVGSEIIKVADIVTYFYRTKANRIIDYRFVFPLAFMKFSEAEDSSIEKLLKDLQKTEKRRRLVADAERNEIELFKKKILEQENQLFGISLYYQGIIFLYSDHDDIVEMNKKACQNIMESGNTAIREAKRLLQEVEENPNKINLIREFEFPPIHGAWILDEMTKRTQVLVEAYNQLFPGRPREVPLSEEENLKLMQAAANKLN